MNMDSGGLGLQNSNVLKTNLKAGDRVKFVRDDKGVVGTKKMGVWEGFGRRLLTFVGINLSKQKKLHMQYVRQQSGLSKEFSVKSLKSRGVKILFRPVRLNELINTIQSVKDLQEESVTNAVAAAVRSLTSSLSSLVSCRKTEKSQIKNLDRINKIGLSKTDYLMNATPSLIESSCINQKTVLSDVKKTWSNLSEYTKSDLGVQQTLLKVLEQATPKPDDLVIDIPKKMGSTESGKFCAKLNLASKTYNDLKKSCIDGLSMLANCKSSNLLGDVKALNKKYKDLQSKCTDKYKNILKESWESSENTNDNALKTIILENVKKTGLQLESFLSVKSLNELKYSDLKVDKFSSYLGPIIMKKIVLPELNELSKKLNLENNASSRATVLGIIKRIRKSSNMHVKDKDVKNSIIKILLQCYSKDSTSVNIDDFYSTKELCAGTFVLPNGWHNLLNTSDIADSSDLMSLFSNLKMENDVSKQKTILADVKKTWSNLSEYTKSDLGVQKAIIEIIQGGYAKLGDVFPVEDISDFKMENGTTLASGSGSLLTKKSDQGYTINRYELDDNGKKGFKLGKGNQVIITKDLSKGVLLTEQFIKDCVDRPGYSFRNIDSNGSSDNKSMIKSMQDFCKDSKVGKNMTPLFLSRFVQQGTMAMGWMYGLKIFPAFTKTGDPLYLVNGNDRIMDFKFDGTHDDDSSYLTLTYEQVVHKFIADKFIGDTLKPEKRLFFEAKFKFTKENMAKFGTDENGMLLLRKDREPAFQEEKKKVDTEEQKLQGEIDKLGENQSVEKKKLNDALRKLKSPTRSELEESKSLCIGVKFYSIPIV